MIQQHILPRWRGFNLPDAVGMDSPGFFQKEDFEMIADLGFDFVRLPVNYRFWAGEDPFSIQESNMAFLDDAVSWGDRYGLHVNLALHRAPGYCVAKNPPEPFDLFADEPSLELARQGQTAQSCRGYLPKGITHYMAEWVRDYQSLPAPQWPDSPERPKSTVLWNSEMLFQHYQAWASLSDIYGIGIHCGEGGCYNRTPHPVALHWMEDWLNALRCANIGYALWNLRGDFGILDSKRDDAAYTKYHGHLLDKKMLRLMLKY